jgi:putative ATP-binding cassette transporter
VPAACRIPATGRPAISRLKDPDMTALAATTAIFALALLVGGQFGTASLPIYVPVSGFLLAGVIYLARSISPYLRIFIVMYSLGYLLLAALAFLAVAGVLPSAVAELLPPPFAASAAMVFAALVYAASHIPVIRTITALADPFFRADTPSTTFGRLFAWIGPTEGSVGRRLVALLIAINFLQVAIQIRLNVWYRDLFNALQEKNADVFWYQIFGIFAPLAFVWISIAVYEIYVDSSLHIRWRSWLTRKITGRWLADGTHYRVPFTGEPADNPDQRIQADIRAFIDQTMSLSIRLLSQAATLVSFVVILWGLSRDFVIPGTSGLVIPGFLVWLVIAYAVIGTWLTHLIGRPLVRLDFRQEKVEADFRFSLARLREYGEQVALLGGERAETARLNTSFSAIVANYLQILSRRMKLTTFTGGYSQLSVIFPYVLAAPSYFLGKITLGQFQQTASAFNRVEGALSFFIAAYTTLAAYKANIDRLTTFNAAMSKAEALGSNSEIALAQGKGSDLTIERLELALPDGRRIAQVGPITLTAGESVLVTGPSGSGKSTLFRALSGIWPFGRGRIAVPEGRSVMLLPQKPYVPTGTLAAALVYPGLPNQYGASEIQDALGAVGLGPLVDRLDSEEPWAQQLSGGEQQRLAIARALLLKPDWLFLDEATASLDEESEAAIYDLLGRRLPDTTIVSIGHRSTLVAMHDRQIEMRPHGDGMFELRGRTESAPLPAAT